MRLRSACRLFKSIRPECFFVYTTRLEALNGKVFVLRVVWCCLRNDDRKQTVVRDAWWRRASRWSAWLISAEIKPSTGAGRSLTDRLQRAERNATRRGTLRGEKRYAERNATQRAPRLYSEFMMITARMLGLVNTATRRRAYVPYYLSVYCYI